MNQKPIVGTEEIPRYHLQIIERIRQAVMVIVPRKLATEFDINIQTARKLLAQYGKQ
jgi:hypothetical protein